VQVAALDVVHSIAQGLTRAMLLDRQAAHVTTVTTHC
jgi:hypothetical protein